MTDDTPNELDRISRPRVQMDIEFVHPYDLRNGMAIVQGPEELPEIVRDIRMGKDRHGPFVAIRTDRNDRLVFREGDKLAKIL